MYNVVRGDNFLKSILFIKLSPGTLLEMVLMWMSGGINRALKNLLQLISYLCLQIILESKVVSEIFGLLATLMVGFGIFVSLVDCQT